MGSTLRQWRATYGSDRECAPNACFGPLLTNASRSRSTSPLFGTGIVDALWGLLCGFVFRFVGHDPPRLRGTAPARTP
jgi:hypothetical protein